MDRSEKSSKIVADVVAQTEGFRLDDKYEIIRDIFLGLENANVRRAVLITLLQEIEGKDLSKTSSIVIQQAVERAYRQAERERQSDQSKNR